MFASVSKSCVCNCKAVLRSTRLIILRKIVQNPYFLNDRLISGSAHYNFTNGQLCKTATVTTKKPPYTNCKCVINRSFYKGHTDEDIVFRQLLEYKSYTYTYLLGDATTNEAILIDPVIETAERDIRIVYELGLKLIYAVNTHVHADHITGTGEIKKLLPSCKSIIAEASGAKADITLEEGDLIKFGKCQIEARSTPGHTDGCMSFVWHDKGMVFTGDALLIRGCGRTDFQQGNAGVLYDSVHNKILSLPKHFRVFPAHDYTGQSMTTIGEEMRFNPRLTRPKKEFTEMMSKLNLPYPQQMEKAVPINMMCGVFNVPPSKI